MKVYLLFADEYGGDGCDWTVELKRGSYKECQKEMDRLCGLCSLQYWSYQIVSEDEINGLR